MCLVKGIHKTFRISIIFIKIFCFCAPSCYYLLFSQLRLKKKPDLENQIFIVFWSYFLRSNQNRNHFVVTSSKVQKNCKILVLKCYILNVHTTSYQCYGRWNDVDLFLRREKILKNWKKKKRLA